MANSGQFQSGRSGNPAGKPKGTRSRVNRLYGTSAEPMVREIRDILDKAIPSRRRGRPTK